MNKIYKVKKNAAGNSVACSEFAKGHAKKAVLGSLLVIGTLSMATTASAYSVEQFFPNIFDSASNGASKYYHNMVVGDTAITTDLQDNSDNLKFYSNDKNSVPDSLLFTKMLHEQLLNGFKKGDTIIPLDENGKPVYTKDYRLDGHTGKVREVYSVTTKIATEDDVNSAYSRGIQGDIDDLYEANAENVNRLIEHGDKIWANEESVQYLNKEVQNNINNIHELAQQQDQHTSDIKNLSKASLTNTKRIATAEMGINQNKADIAKNKTTLDQHAKQIDDNKKDFEAKLGGKADEQKLAELKTSVDKNKATADAKFAATEDALTRNAKNITKNTTSIRDLNTKVDGFDGRISALDAKVNGFDGRINALDDKFKNGMAAQAALNGLFQPYSVGKVSVSAAIGGYGSKSAIAIGTGYRVNPQLAFKGGTAINVSGSKKSSYNIGVNYEF